MNNEIQAYLAKGVFVGFSVSPEKIREFANKLKPKKIDFPLVRIGPKFDGGYLIPDDLEGVDACFSPGVSTYAHFENDLYNKYGVNSHLADFSVDGPPSDCTPLSFRKKFLGAYSDNIYLTLEQWFLECGGIDADYILQMDIEGAEYEAILSTPDYILRKFRTIVLEMHDLDRLAVPEFYRLADAMLGKISQFFHVVHVHPNNYGGIININGVNTPKVIEVTFHRKDRSETSGNVVDFPHPEDAPCCPQLPDYVLPEIYRS